MTNRAEIFLGVIAVATLAIALAQVGVVIVAALAARRVTRLAESVERDLKPIFHHLDTIGRDASKAAALAAVQVERADKLFAEVVVRVEQAMNTVQTTIEAPAREGRALLSALRAAIQAIRDMRSGAHRQGRAEDEDALFI